jgi:enhancing lycopene biosynthesis protein 2
MLDMAHLIVGAGDGSSRRPNDAIRFTADAEAVSPHSNDGDACHKAPQRWHVMSTKPASFYCRAAATVAQVRRCNHLTGALLQPPHRCVAATTSQVRRCNHLTGASLQPPHRRIAATTSQMQITHNCMVTRMSDISAECI